MSSSIFTYYKIVSINENIKDIYVGKTTNFKKRVREHKNRCYNENDKKYNIKLYQFIRENGGWDNFNFIEIETNEYDDKDSSIRERYWIEELNATLNSYIPSRTSKEYQKYRKENKKEQNKKNNKKYYEKNVEKINKKITCECGCEIVKRSLSIHLKTQKHQDYLLLNTK
jgi:hypothetical protein